MKFSKPGFAAEKSRCQAREAKKRPCASRTSSDGPIQLLQLRRGCSRDFQTHWNGRSPSFRPTACDKASLSSPSSAQRDRSKRCYTARNTQIHADATVRQITQASASSISSSLESPAAPGCSHSPSRAPSLTTTIASLFFELMRIMRRLAE